MNEKQHHQGAGVLDSKNSDTLISGVILAGGRGNRLGGRDKGLVDYRGRPLVEHVIAAIAPQVDELIINANRNTGDYARYGYPVIGDRLPGFPGPLAGLLAGLERAAHDYVLCVPCDTPALPVDLAARLLDGLRQAAVRAAVADDGERTHPVCALLRRDLRDELAAWLARGGRRAGDWMASIGAVAVDFSDCPAAFDNLNSPADLVD